MVTPGSSKPASPPTKFDHIDALRGIAVLLVVLVHTGGRTPAGMTFGEIAKYGQYGVQLFFMLSAFTLCHSMNRIQVLGKPDYLAFMTKRFFRIAPLYYLGIVIYFIFTWASFRFAHQTPFTEPGEYSALGVISNVLFLHGLIPAGNSNVVPGGWSIGCEFLFYAMFPFLFLAARSNKSVLIFSTIAAALATLGIHLLTTRVYGMKTELNSFTFFTVFNQFPCFILGMIYYFYGKIPAVRVTFIALLLPALIAVFGLHSLAWGWCLLPFTAGVAAVGLSFLMVKCGIPFLLKKIGQLSFSIYLWHFLVVWNVSYIFKMKLPGSDLVSVLQFFVIVIITCILAAISNLVIELPGIKLGSKLAEKFREKTIGAVPPDASREGEAA